MPSQVPADEATLLQEAAWAGDPADWNDTALAYDDTVTLEDLIRRQVGTAPDAPALVFEGESLTYAGMDRRAAALADHLRSLGVGPETLVALLLERSAAMIIAVLAIHRAGGAYLPIDASYPPDRMAFMLRDSGARFVVTEEALRGRLPEHDATVVSLDGDRQALDAAEGWPAGAAPGGPERLAYVIYTSGSTGVPKGVQIEQRNVVNFLAGMSIAVPMGPGDTLVAVTPLSFDISVLEMFLPLTSGARIVVASRETAGSPAALAALLSASDATHFQATPSTWRMLVDAGWPGRRGLVGLCGGEALPQPLADALVGRGIELWNVYGPTEATIWATMQRQERVGQPVTIGRPMANVTAHVLDEALRSQPIGEQGELWLGGRGLARGYLNRPELTAERFITHPATGERLYRTGDLARRLPDGSLHFLGRVDHQVKLRGHRIELGEVEAALARVPRVRASAATVREDSPGDPRLVGYVAVGTAARVAAADLRAELRKTLPPYMVPDAFVVLEEMPLNANGKIDRKQLPAPVARAADRPLVPPRTSLEARLVAIWQEVLDVSPIGVTDDFFDLGATSLTAARLFVRIEEEIGAKLPLSPLFQAPTIQKLAALIEGSAAARRWTSLVPVQPHGTRTPIFCVHGGAGTILHFHPLAQRLGGDQPFYGLQMRGLYGDAPLHLTAERMADHYLKEIRAIQPHGPYVLAGYCFGVLPAYDMAQRLRRAGEEVALLISINGPSPAYVRARDRARVRTAGAIEPDAAMAVGAELAAGAVRALPAAPGPAGPSAVDEASCAIGVDTPSAVTPAGGATPAAGSRARTNARERRPGTLKRMAASLRRLRTNLRGPRLRIHLANAASDLLTRLGRPVPDAWRERAIFHVTQRIEHTYRPRPYAGRMLTFRAPGLYRDPELGWTDHVTGGIEAHDVPGRHTTQRDAMHEPAVDFVAERITAALEQVLPRQAGNFPSPGPSESRGPRQPTP